MKRGALCLWGADHGHHDTLALAEWAHYRRINRCFQRSDGGAGISFVCPRLAVRLGHKRAREILRVQMFGFHRAGVAPSASLRFAWILSLLHGSPSSVVSSSAPQ